MCGGGGWIQVFGLGIVGFWVSGSKMRHGTAVPQRFPEWPSPALTVSKNGPPQGTRSLCYIRAHGWKPLLGAASPHSISEKISSLKVVMKLLLAWGILALANLSVRATLSANFSLVGSREGWNDNEDVAAYLVSLQRHLHKDSAADVLVKDRTVKVEAVSPTTPYATVFETYITKNRFDRLARTFLSR